MYDYIDSIADKVHTRVTSNVKRNIGSKSIHGTHCFCVCLAIEEKLIAFCSVPQHFFFGESENENTETVRALNIALTSLSSATCLASRCAMSAACATRSAVRTRSISTRSAIATSRSRSAASRASFSLASEALACLSYSSNRSTCLPASSTRPLTTSIVSRRGPGSLVGRW